LKDNSKVFYDQVNQTYISTSIKEGAKPGSDQVTTMTFSSDGQPAASTDVTNIINPQAAFDYENSSSSGKGSMQASQQVESKL